MQNDEEDSGILCYCSSMFSVAGLVDGNWENIQVSKGRKYESENCAANRKLGTSY